MELVFKSGNDNVDLGWASNNSCRLVRIVLDDREEEDDMKGDHWELKYLPVGMIVEPVGIDADDVGEVSENLPKGTFFVGTNYETVEMEIPAAVRKRYDIPHQAPPMIKIRRTGFKLVPGVAVTDFFAQGQTFKGHPVVIDLRMPPNGKVSMSGFYVMLSRATTLDDVYLLHPLWPHGDDAAKDAFVALAQRQYRFDDDMKAEEVRLRRKHEATLDRYKHVKLHYVDRSVSPHKCATCGEPV